MEALVRSPAARTAELHLLTEWGEDRSRVRSAGVLSVAAHVVVIIALILAPRSLITRPRQVATRITPLIEPLTELTQKAPNKGKVSKEITVEALLPHPRVHVPQAAPAIARRPAPRNVPQQAPSPPPLPEPPRLDAGNRSAQPPTGLPPGPQTAQAAPPPQIQATEQPKLAFETPTAPPPSGGQGRVAIPDTSVSGAIRSLAHDGSEGATSVGDLNEIGVGGIGLGMNLPPSPGRSRSALQLLSDPMGIDFRPYLIKVLASVRRNWFAVYPESAKLGARGRVEIQFAISKDGSIPKLVYILQSGSEALDRAAVAGISASNPLPPLPTEFRGEVVRLQLTFLYNMQQQRR
jgi:TonB family protein